MIPRNPFYAQLLCMNKVLTIPEDKIGYIVSEMKEKYGRKRRLWVITDRRVKAVLLHAPRNANNITFKEFAAINNGLITPVTTDFIADVMELSRLYDDIKTDNIKKPPKSTHNESSSHYPSTSAKLCCNI